MNLLGTSSSVDELKKRIAERVGSTPSSPRPPDTPKSPTANSLEELRKKIAERTNPHK